MPVTPAHAVAAVALASLAPKLPLLALVIGTQVPDLPMFFPALTPSYEVTHSWYWGAPVNLAYGLTLLWLCEWVRPAVVALLPEVVRRRLSGPLDSTISQHCFWRLGGAVVIGAATHLLWDEFTHASGLGVRALPILERPWLHMQPGYKVLQHSSGVLGVMFLSWWVLRVYRRTPPHADWTPRWREPVRKLLQLMLLVIAPLSCWTAAYQVTLHRGAPSRFLHELAYRGITSTFAATLVLCIAVRMLFALPSCRSCNPPPASV